MDLVNDFEQLVDDRRRQTERQLVDHEQLRASQESLAEAEHLLLATREAARRRRPATLQRGEVFEHPRGRFLDARLVLAVQPRRGAEVLLDGQGREDSPTTGNLRDAELRGGVRIGGGDVVAVEQDRTVRRGRQPGDGAQHRGLARAVGAKERHDLALVDVEVDTEEHLRLAVGDVESLARLEAVGRSISASSPSPPPWPSWPRRLSSAPVPARVRACRRCGGRQGGLAPPGRGGPRSIAAPCRGCGYMPPPSPPGGRAAAAICRRRWR